MLQPQWLADLSAERRAKLRGEPDAHRHGVPVLVRRSRRRAGACAATGRGDAGPGHDVSVLAPSSPHVALPDYVVSGGKAVPIPYNGSVARLRFGPATPAGQTLAGRRRFRRAAPARAQRAEPVDAGADDRRGPDRRDLPHLDHEVADAVSVFQGILRPCTRRSSAASRCPIWPGAGRWRRSAATPWRSPTASTWRRSPAPPLDGYPRPGKSVLFLGRFDEPRKGHGGAAGCAARAGRAVPRHRDPGRRPR